jgi:hypothetical protein
MTDFGCEMGEDIASDQGINDFVDQYLNGVYLRNLTGSSELYLNVIKELGLTDEPETLLALESVVRAAADLTKTKGNDD